MRWDEFFCCMEVDRFVCMGKRCIGIIMFKWGFFLFLLGGIVFIVGYWGFVFYFEYCFLEVFEL